MIDDELSFYVEKDGESVRCDIVAMIPGEEDYETYVAFVDHLETKTDTEIQYAKIIGVGDTYRIEEFENPVIVDQLKEMVANNVKEYIDKEMGNSYE